MEWALAIVAAALLGVGAVSGRISGTVLTPAMLFVAIGLLVGPRVLDGVFRACLRRSPGEINRLTEELGDALSGATFLLFGAILLGPAPDGLSWEIALYAVLSLTVVRMVPVAMAMLGSRARPPTTAFLGWFGPRGLASIVFAVILIEESHLPEQGTILPTIYLTVGLSVLLHGITAAPLARRYGCWCAAQPDDRLV